MEKPDPREQPSYTVPEAARCLRLSAPAVRCWSAGRPPDPPLIVLPRQSGRRPVLLSFFNLVELHMLAVMRRRRGVSAPKVAVALDFLRRALVPADRERPLLSRALTAGGLDPFVEKCGELTNLGRSGRAALRRALEAALGRIVRDDRGAPAKLYPFTRAAAEDAPKLIAVEPGLSAGRPVIDGTGLAAEIIAERYKAGESMRELARDYGRSAAEIEEAVRCRLGLAA